MSKTDLIFHSHLSKATQSNSSFSKTKELLWEEVTWKVRWSIIPIISPKLTHLEEFRKVRVTLAAFHIKILKILIMWETFRTFSNMIMIEILMYRWVQYAQRLDNNLKSLITVLHIIKATWFWGKIHNQGHLQRDKF